MKARSRQATVVPLLLGSVVAILVAALVPVPSAPAVATTLDGTVVELGTGAKPVAALADGSGSVFLLNEGDATISKITPTGALLRVFASLGTACRPQAMTIDTAGFLYAACGGTDSVTRVSPSGVVIAYWAYDGLGSMPRGIAADPAGNVFVSNWGTSTITEITASGTVLPVFARLDPADRPLGLATDSAGALYVADTQTDRVSKISPTGVVREVFAELPRGAGSPTTPVAVAVDPWGTLYTSNSSGSVSTFASDGSLRAATVSLPPGPHRPTGIVLDGYGDAFVGDELAHAVTGLDASGGPAASLAAFAAPAIVRAVTLSGSGLYAADYVSGTVHRVELAPALPGTPVSATLWRGHPAALDVASTGFGTQIVISVGVLPPGLTLEGSTGRISGMPSAPGSYSFDIVAVNHWGATSPQRGQITVRP